MEFLKQWTLCICASVICAVIMSVFAPKGNMRGFYKILISFFVFFSFLYPLSSKNAVSLSELFDNVNVLQTDIYTKNPYEDTVKEQVSTVLKQHGIKGACVMPEIETDFESGEITVQSLKIAVGDEYDREEVRNIVFDTLGMNAEVTGIGD